MSANISRSALLVLSLGVLPAGRSVHAQTTIRAAAASESEAIEVSYHLQELKRNEGGRYEMQGSLRGERQGEARVSFGFEGGSSGQPGAALVQAHWVVRAEPASESFEATLRGTADLVSGQTHLKGTITDGAGKGQPVETKSRLLNYGANGALSDIDGRMVISAGGGAKVTPLMTKDLAGVEGKETLMLAVEYPPGADEPVHRHNAQAFVYVLEGSLVMQVKGQRPDTLKAGDTYYEGNEDVHLVGRNASQTDPARFVVVLVKEKGAPAVLPAQ